MNSSIHLNKTKLLLKSASFIMDPHSTCTCVCACYNMYCCVYMCIHAITGKSSVHVASSRSGYDVLNSKLPLLLVMHTVKNDMLK